MNLRHKKFFIFRTLLASALILCLFINDIVYAADPHTKSFDPLKIPETLGRVDESFTGKNSKTIFYIQDAHDSLEAQQNIAKLIHRLVAKENVKTVYEEGYEGSVPTDKFFGFIKNPDTKEKAAYFLMDKLRLSGAEYAHITRFYPHSDPLPKRERGKSTIPSPRLSARGRIRLHFGGRGEGRVRGDFNLIGADSIPLHLKNIKKYREFSKYRPQTQKDLAALSQEIRLLADQTFPKALKNWLKLQERYEAGHLDLLEYIKRTSAVGAGLKPAPTINVEVIFQEIDNLENATAQKYLKSEKDQQIFRYQKQVRLLRRLSEMQITSSEYEAVKLILKKINTQEIADFVARQAHKPVLLSRRWELAIRCAVDFYEIAQERNQAIAKALDAFIANPDEEKAVLVFGGFHREGIQQLLKEKNLSYHILSPHMSGADPVRQEYYKRLMTNGYHAFEIPLMVKTAARPEAILEMELKPTEIYRHQLERWVTQYAHLPKELLVREVSKKLGEGGMAEGKINADAAGGATSLRGDDRSTPSLREKSQMQLWSMVNPKFLTALRSGRNYEIPALRGDLSDPRSEVRRPANDFAAGSSIQDDLRWFSKAGNVTIDEDGETFVEPGGKALWPNGKQAAIERIHQIIETAKKEISPRDTDQQPGGEYLQASPTRVIHAFEAAGLQPEQTVIDLGHGTGDALFTAAHFSGAKGVGAEWNDYRYRQSVAARDALIQARMIFKNQVDLRPGDFNALSFKDADYLFYYSHGGSSESIDFKKIIDEMKPGAKFLLLGVRDEDLDRHKATHRYQNFAPLLASGQFDWERNQSAGVWIFTKKNPFEGWKSKIADWRYAWTIPELNELGQWFSSWIKTDAQNWIPVMEAFGASERAALMEIKKQLADLGDPEIAVNLQKPFRGPRGTTDWAFEQLHSSLLLAKAAVLTAASPQEIKSWAVQILTAGDNSDEFAVSLIADYIGQRPMRMDDKDFVRTHIVPVIDWSHRRRMLQELLYHKITGKPGEAFPAANLTRQLEVLVEEIRYDWKGRHGRPLFSDVDFDIVKNADVLAHASEDMTFVPFMELLRNAVSVLPKVSGHYTGKIRMEVKQEAGQVQYIISNSGRPELGLDAEKIFLPHRSSRLNGEIEKIYFENKNFPIGGEGLGLYKARLIAALHGGSLIYDPSRSRDQNGQPVTTFILSYPIARSGRSEVRDNKLVFINKKDGMEIDEDYQKIASLLDDSEPLASFLSTNGVKNFAGIYKDFLAHIVSELEMNAENRSKRGVLLKEISLYRAEKENGRPSYVLRATVLQAGISMEKYWDMLKRKSKKFLKEGPNYLISTSEDGNGSEAGLSYVNKGTGMRYVGIVMRATSVRLEYEKLENDVMKTDLWIDLDPLLLDESRSEARQPLKPLEELTWNAEDAEAVVMHFRAVMAQFHYPLPRAGVIEGPTIPLTAENLKKFAGGKTPAELYKKVRHEGIAISMGATLQSWEEPFHAAFGIWPNGVIWFLNAGWSSPFVPKGVVDQYLSSRKTGEQPIKVLVHGAWNGEDAYSAAILLRELAPQAEFEIIAKDRVQPNPEELNWFSEEDVPERLRDVIGRYFVYKKRDEYPWAAALALRDDQRGLVTTFKQGDIRDPASIEPGMDMVIVNRVFRYISSDPETKQSLENIWNSLAPGGILITERYPEKPAAFGAVLENDLAGRFELLAPGVYRKLVPAHLEARGWWYSWSSWFRSLRQPVFKMLADGRLHYLDSGAFTHVFIHPDLPGQVILIKHSPRVLKSMPKIEIPVHDEAGEWKMYLQLDQVHAAAKTKFIGKFPFGKVRLEQPADDAERKRREEAFRYDSRYPEDELSIYVQERGFPLDRRLNEETSTQRKYVTAGLITRTHHMWRSGLMDLDLRFQNYMLHWPAGGKFSVIEKEPAVVIHDFGEVFPLPSAKGGEAILNFLQTTMPGADISNGIFLMISLSRPKERTFELGRRLFPSVDFQNLFQILEAADQARKSVTGLPAKKAAYLGVLQRPESKTAFETALHAMAKTIASVWSGRDPNDHGTPLGPDALRSEVRTKEKRFDLRRVWGEQAWESDVTYQLYHNLYDASGKTPAEIHKELSAFVQFLRGKISDFQDPWKSPEELATLPLQLDDGDLAEPVRTLKQLERVHRWLFKMFRPLQVKDATVRDNHFIFNLVDPEKRVPSGGYRAWGTFEVLLDSGKNTLRINSAIGKRQVGEADEEETEVADTQPPSGQFQIKPDKAILEHVRKQRRFEWRQLIAALRPNHPDNSKKISRTIKLLQGERYGVQTEALQLLLDKEEFDGVTVFTESLRPWLEAIVAVTEAMSSLGDHRGLLKNAREGLGKVNSRHSEARNQELVVFPAIQTDPWPSMDNTDYVTYQTNRNQKPVVLELDILLLDAYFQNWTEQQFSHVDIQSLLLYFASDDVIDLNEWKVGAMINFNFEGESYRLRVTEKIYEYISPLLEHLLSGPHQINLNAYLYDALVRLEGPNQVAEKHGTLKSYPWLTEDLSQKIRSIVSQSRARNIILPRSEVRGIFKRRRFENKEAFLAEAKRILDGKSMSRRELAKAFGYDKADAFMVFARAYDVTRADLEPLGVVFSKTLKGATLEERRKRFETKLAKAVIDTEKEVHRGQPREFLMRVAVKTGIRSLGNFLYRAGQLDVDLAAEPYQLMLPPFKVSERRQWIMGKIAGRLSEEEKQTWIVSVLNLLDLDLISLTGAYALIKLVREGKVHVKEWEGEVAKDLALNPGTVSRQLFGSPVSSTAGRTSSVFSFLAETATKKLELERDYPERTRKSAQIMQLFSKKYLFPFQVESLLSDELTARRAKEFFETVITATAELTKRESRILRAIVRKGFGDYAGIAADFKPRLKAHDIKRVLFGDMQHMKQTGAYGKIRHTLVTHPEFADEFRRLRFEAGIPAVQFTYPFFHWLVLRRHLGTVGVRSVSRLVLYNADRLPPFKLPDGQSFSLEEKRRLIAAHFSGQSNAWIAAHLSKVTGNPLQEEIALGRQKIEKWFAGKAPSVSPRAGSVEKLREALTPGEILYQAVHSSGLFQEAGAHFSKPEVSEIEISRFLENLEFRRTQTVSFLKFASQMAVSKRHSLEPVFQAGLAEALKDKSYHLASYPVLSAMMKAIGQNAKDPHFVSDFYEVLLESAHVWKNRLPQDWIIRFLTVFINAYDPPAIAPLSWLVRGRPRNLYWQKIYNAVIETVYKPIKIIPDKDWKRYERSIKFISESEKFDLMKIEAKVADHDRRVIQRQQIVSEFLGDEQAAGYWPLPAMTGYAIRRYPYMIKSVPRRKKGRGLNPAGMDFEILLDAIRDALAEAAYRYNRPAYMQDLGPIEDALERKKVIAKLEAHRLILKHKIEEAEKTSTVKPRWTYELQFLEVLAAAHRAYEVGEKAWAESFFKRLPDMETDIRRKIIHTRFGIELHSRLHLLWRKHQRERKTVWALVSDLKDQPPDVPDVVEKSAAQSEQMREQLGRVMQQVTLSPRNRMVLELYYGFDPLYQGVKLGYEEIVQILAFRKVTGSTGKLLVSTEVVQRIIREAKTKIAQGLVALSAEDKVKSWDEFWKGLDQLPADELESMPEPDAVDVIPDKKTGWIKLGHQVILNLPQAYYEQTLYAALADYFPMPLSAQERNQYPYDPALKRRRFPYQIILNFRRSGKLVLTYLLDFYPLPQGGYQQRSAAKIFDAAGTSSQPGRSGPDALRSEVRTRGQQWWTKEKIKTAIAYLHQHGVPLNSGAISKDKSEQTRNLLFKLFGKPVNGLALYGRAVAPEYYGDWEKALQAAGLDPAEIQKEYQWSRLKITTAIYYLNQAGIPLNWHAIYKNKSEKVTAILKEVLGYPVKSQALASSAVKHFGSWEAALKAAGLDPSVIQPHMQWSKLKIGTAIFHLYQAGISLKPHDIRYDQTEETKRILKYVLGKSATGSDLYAVVKSGNYFKTWADALNFVGIDPESVYAYSLFKWTRLKITAALYHLYLQGVSIRGGDLQNDKSPQTREILKDVVGTAQYGARLYREGFKEFGRWEAALQAAGIDPVKMWDSASAAQLQKELEGWIAQRPLQPVNLEDLKQRYEPNLKELHVLKILGDMGFVATQDGDYQYQERQIAPARPRPASQKRVAPIVQSSKVEAVLKLHGFLDEILSRQMGVLVNVASLKGQFAPLFATQIRRELQQKNFQPVNPDLYLSPGLRLEASTLGELLEKDKADFIWERILRSGVASLPADVKPTLGNVALALGHGLTAREIGAVLNKWLMDYTNMGIVRDYEFWIPKSQVKNYFQNLLRQLPQNVMPTPRHLAIGMHYEATAREIENLLKIHSLSFEDIGIIPDSPLPLPSSRLAWIRFLLEAVRDLPQSRRPTPENIADAAPIEIQADQIRTAIADYGLSYGRLGMVRAKLKRRSRLEWIEFLKDLKSKLIPGKDPTAVNLAALTDGEIYSQDIRLALHNHHITQEDVEITLREFETDRSRAEWVTFLKELATQLPAGMEPNANNLEAYSHGRVTGTQIRKAVYFHEFSYDEAGLVLEHEQRRREDWIKILSGLVQSLPPRVLPTPENLAAHSKGQWSSTQIRSALYTHKIPYEAVGVSPTIKAYRDYLTFAQTSGEMQKEWLVTGGGDDEKKQIVVGRQREAVAGHIPDKELAHLIIGAVEGLPEQDQQIAEALLTLFERGETQTQDIHYLAGRIGSTSEALQRVLGNLYAYAEDLLESREYFSASEDTQDTSRSELRRIGSTQIFENKRIFVDFKDLVKHFSAEQIKEMMFTAQQPHRNVQMLVYGLDWTLDLGMAKLLESQKSEHFKVEALSLAQMAEKYAKDFKGETIHLSSAASGVKASLLKDQLKAVVDVRQFYGAAYEDQKAGTLGALLKDLSTGSYAIKAQADLVVRLPYYIEDANGHLAIADRAAAGLDAWSHLYDRTLAFSRAA